LKPVPQCHHPVAGFGVNAFQPAPGLSHEQDSIQWPSLKVCIRNISGMQTYGDQQVKVDVRRRRIAAQSLGGFRISP